MLVGSVVAVVAALLFGALGGRPSGLSTSAVAAEAARPAQGTSASPPGLVALNDRFTRQIRPLLDKHCSACHANGKHKGDVDLDPFKDVISVQSARDQWGHISEVIKQKVMPPESKPPIPPAELAALTSWVEDALAFCDCSGPRDPGRVAIHRLNRTEYNNTIRDLLGVDFEPDNDFSADDTGYGFDNIADVLTMSPLLAEKYLAAADRIMDDIIPSENARPRVKRISEASIKYSGDTNGAGIIAGKGEATFTHQFSGDGAYELVFHGFQRRAGQDNAKVLMKLDGKDVGTFNVSAGRENSESFKLKFDATDGKHKVSLSLANPATQDDPRTKRTRTRSATMEWVEISGPIQSGPAKPSPLYRRLVFAEPGNGLADEAAARPVLQRFLTRAYRRPAQADELAAILSLFKSARAEGDTYPQAIRLCCTAVLCSPHFLFRVEIDPKGADSDADHPQPYAISDYELASRLSYFLWSSMPDDVLFAAAASKKLREPGELEAQVVRMLKDSRSSALVDNFVGQWLELRNLADYKPDPTVYPAFDDALREAMQTETRDFVQYIMTGDRSLFELLSADYTFVNERLAKHYGLAGVSGPEFRKVSVHGTGRGGLLTQASILTVTGMPTRTSPVKRGKFILDNILGTPPPPPPANVPTLSEDAKDTSTATLKVRLEAHRKDPNCAVCHIKMDAIGFSLENFDAIGGFRTRDGKFAVDSRGTLPDGSTIEGSDGLRQMLLQQRNAFLNTMVRKMLTYALGRGLEHYDQCTVKDIEAACAKDGYKFSSLVLAIVKSDAFEKRRALKPEEMRQRQEKSLDEREKKS